MKRCLAFAVLILAVAALPQGVSLAGQVEHAPTVAQCQADQRLWFAKLETTPTDINLPSFYTLQAWQHEMGDCEEVDDSNRLKYYNTREEASEVQSNHMLNFLSRHGLWNKFIEEDAAGKR